MRILRIRFRSRIPNTAYGTPAHLIFEVPLGGRLEGGRRCRPVLQGQMQGHQGRQDTRSHPPVSWQSTGQNLSGSPNLSGGEKDLSAALLWNRITIFTGSGSDL